MLVALSWADEFGSTSSEHLTTLTASGSDGVWFMVGAWRRRSNVEYQMRIPFASCTVYSWSAAFRNVQLDIYVRWKERDWGKSML